MKISIKLLPVFFLILFFSCDYFSPQEQINNQTVHQDEPFIQDFSIKYYFNEDNIELKKVFSDRNGNIKVLSSGGLLQPHDGQFLFPGSLVPDRTYLPLADKNITDIGVHNNQFIYLDDQAVFSNAWAGSLFLEHQINSAHLLAAGADFDFLISDGTALQYLNQSGKHWKQDHQGQDIIDIKFDEQKNIYWILSPNSLHSVAGPDFSLKTIKQGENFTCFEVIENGNKVLLGTTNGYREIESGSGKETGDINNKLPWPFLTYIKEINGNVWFGSEKGAFKLREDGKFDYYFGERWLPGEKIIHIAEGDDNAVLLLTDQGLGKIVFKAMTLNEKAEYFEDQVRQRHIRYGFNSDLTGMERGNINTGRLKDSDNDGLWTSMYLGAQAFRYAVTKSEEALQNCRESLDAMERLYAINPVPGFPSRSFARSGYIDQLADPDRWQHAEHPEWDWKATTSSDEAIGHIFVFGVLAELIDDPDIREKSINLIDTLMQHIVENDWYLIDYDGKPTTWGRWNPEYVNSMPEMVGDRKLNSSNIVAMLQTAYHFTKKEIYKDKAFELMNDHGYFENLMRPMKEIGQAPEDGEDLGKMLSGSWNHSDDEMYFLGYWGLYRYAFNDTLKSRYKEAIIDHWEMERPEKEGAWNIFTALTGVSDFDLPEAIWFLQEYPLDLINWTMVNSHRKDIEILEPNFRRQTTAEVLPPDELKISRHNANRFTLDGGNGGTSENSAGDIWLLPYWMGRYLGVIKN